MASTQQRRVGPLRGLALFLGGCVAAILLVELVLQAGALVVHLTGRDGPRAWSSSDVRILAIGDSNTFGLYLDAEESYPSQLQELWNTTVGSPKIEVLNLGYPSTNSSYLRASFERILDAFDPDLVLVQIGVNDYWTAPLENASAGAGPGVVDAALRRYSRAYKLVYMLRQSLVAPKELEIDFNRDAVFDAGQDLNHTGFVRLGGEEFRLSQSTGGEEEAKNESRPFAVNDSELVANLAAMVADARERGIAPVLVTYPSGYFMYGAANRALRRSARASGSALIDPAVEFKRRCSDESCPEYLFEDHHANAEGYRIVAEVAKASLVPMLTEPRRDK